MPSAPRSRIKGPARQHGAALILVMLILIVVSGLGIGAAQIALMGERSARNDRDMQVAWQAAEAALMDAEFDIRGPLASERRDVFGTGGAVPDRTQFPTGGCGSTGWATGLCALVDEAQAGAGPRPSWLTVDFTLEDATAPTARFGRFTGQDYPAGAGVRPVKPPRYIVEPIRDDWDMRDKSLTTEARYLYRITAMGFGPRPDIQAVAQMILRP